MIKENSPTEHEKLRYLEMLDQVSIRYEAIWGIGKLPALSGADIHTKWIKQQEKLDAAIESGTLDEVRDIVQGSVRAYEIMDASARKLGHKPMDADCWEVRHPETGTLYRIYKSNTETFAPQSDGAIVYSLVEIARILEAHQLVNVVKDHFPGVVVTKIDNIDWKSGDKIGM